MSGPGAMPAIVRAMREHPDAPRWNHSAGDRLDGSDLAWLERFREALEAGRGPRAPGPPPPAVLARVSALRERTEWLRRHVPAGADLERDWAALPTMSREDVALRPELLVPDDADLPRMLVYRTAGTTGHALLVPHDARAVACYLPLLELAARRHGASLEFGPDRAGCFLVGAQARTVTLCTTLSAWGGTGFAKLNLRPSEWPRAGSPGRFVEHFAPPLVTGDPISFAELLRAAPGLRPRALVSTAVGMSAGLRRRLAAAFACPVIDWYSLTETGPIGYLCPLGEGFHVAAHDLHVEVLRPDGAAAGAGERGEIAVTGGRNPFLPLVRYRTGDYGRLGFAPCACGDPMPRILDLEGRAPVLFRAADGSVVNPVDLARALREHPLVQHELVQRADLSCRLAVRPIEGALFREDVLRGELAALLGDVPLDVEIDPELGDRVEGKVLPWRSELLLED